MRRHFAVIIAAAVIATGLTPAAAGAQEPSRSEIFGGFLWTTGLSSGGASTNLFGAVAEGTGYINHWFGMSAEVGWSTRTGASFMEEFRVSELTVAGGPRFRFVNDSRVTPSLRALVGARRDTHTWSYMGYAGSHSRTRLAMFFGGAVDIRASDRISVRVQPDLVLWYYDEYFEASLRLSAGVVVGF